MYCFEAPTRLMQGTGAPEMNVSVVIPVRNGANYIAEALSSALRQVEVTGVVVVDDGSTDATSEIVRSFRDPRVLMVEGKGAGVSAARNCGFRAATVDARPEDWVMFLDADDRLRERAIARLLAASSADCIAVYGNYERINALGDIVGRRSWLGRRRKPDGDILRPLLAGNFIVNGGVALIRVGAMRAIGGFDEGLRYCEDWHAFCKLAALARFRYLDEIVLDYRVHGVSAMMQGQTSNQIYFEAVDRVFSEPRVVARLEPEEIAGLSAQAQAHIRMYLASQALRSRRYARVAPEVTKMLRVAPSKAPRNMVQLLAAAAGI